MPLGVSVVLYVAGLCGVDGVIAAYGAVVAWEPVRASLAEDYVAGDYVLFCNREREESGISYIRRDKG